MLRAFHIVRNDITRMNVDVIVNSANPEPTYAYGTDLAIYSVAGIEQMLKERKLIDAIAPGEVAVTSAGQLKAKYVIHTVAPLWENGDHNEFEILHACYKKALNLAKDLHCKSIAFPLLATGVYGFSKDKALEIAMASIQSFLLNLQCQALPKTNKQNKFLVNFL